MSSKNFNTLVVVTVILIVLSIMMSGKKAVIVADFVRGQELVGFLDLAKLNRVEIQEGDDKVVLERTTQGYVVVSRSNYPADGGRINSLIDKCLKVKCMREIANSADTHKDLGVDEANSEALIIRFKSGDTELVSVITGNDVDSAEYVRRLGDDKVYLSDATLRVSADSLEYVDRSLSDLERERIEKVEMTGNGQPISISKTKDERGRLEGIPEGMVAQSGVADRVLFLLSQLTFVDFMSEADAKEMNFKFGYKCSLDSGELYTYQLAKKDKKWYAKATARYTGPEGLDREQVDKGEKDPKVQKLNEAILQANDKIKAFNARNGSWVYEIDSWVAENMTKAFANMIEEEKDILKADDKDILSVEVAPIQGKAYKIIADAEGKVELQGIPDNKSVKGSDYQLVFTAGKTLRWDSHVDPQGAEVRELEFRAKYSMTLRNGAEFEFRSEVSDNGDKWIKVSARYVGDGKDEKTALLARAMVEKFNTRHGKRVYKVLDLENFSRRFRTLVQAKDAPPESVVASHILITYQGAERSEAKRSKAEAEKLAGEILAQLIADPTKFAELATANSDCSSKSEGGSLGKVGKTGFDPAFTKAALALKVGAMSGVVESALGFHIIKRTE